MDKLLELAASIVEAQASSNALSTEDITNSLRKVYATLRELNNPEDLLGVLASKTNRDASSATDQKEAGTGFLGGLGMSPRDSIQDDHVVCLECGLKMKQITSNHLKSHGLTMRDYKRKYGFRMKDPLSCRATRNARSSRAKERGLPKELVEFQEQRRQAKAKALGHH